MEEIGTGRNIHPKANMGNAIDNDKGDRDSDNLDNRSLDEKYSKGDPLRAIFNVAEMGRFNVEEIGTGRNIHPKANMSDAIDNDKGDRDIDTCRQRWRITAPPRLAFPLSTIDTIF